MYVDISLPNGSWDKEYDCCIYIIVLAGHVDGINKAHCVKKDIWVDTRSYILKMDR